MSLFRVACRVHGGSTGLRYSYLKEKGTDKVQMFDTKEAAETAAEKARESVRGHNGPARFAYWVEQAGGVS